MIVVFDTNVYISFIRDQSHAAELLQRGTRKYLSAVVLMELWAGARTRRAERLIDRLEKPYVAANRVITLRPNVRTSRSASFSPTCLVGTTT